VFIGTARQYCSSTFHHAAITKFEKLNAPAHRPGRFFVRAKRLSNADSTRLASMPQTKPLINANAAPHRRAMSLLPLLPAEVHEAVLAEP
jgi:hypothetical protein